MCSLMALQGHAVLPHPRSPHSVPTAHAWGICASIHAYKSHLLKRKEHSHVPRAQATEVGPEACKDTHAQPSAHQPIMLTVLSLYKYVCLTHVCAPSSLCGMCQPKNG